MKTIRVAKTAGFCFGVERAVNKVYEQAARGVVASIRSRPSSTTKRW